MTQINFLASLGAAIAGVQERGWVPPITTARPMIERSDDLWPGRADQSARDRSQRPADAQTNRPPLHARD